MSTVQLQSIGKFQAKPAGELVVGDVTVWNYGITETVIAIEKRGKSVYATMTYKSNGKDTTGTRRLLQNRLVAFTTRKAN